MLTAPGPDFLCVHFDTLSQGGGLHGNAILTKFDMADVRAIVHTHQPIDWDTEGCGEQEMAAGPPPAWSPPPIASSGGCPFPPSFPMPPRCPSIPPGPYSSLLCSAREGRREPRTGKRVTVSATVSAPGVGAVVVYSIHLEVFTGIIGRVWQFSGARETADGSAHEDIAKGRAVMAKRC